MKNIAVINNISTNNTKEYNRIKDENNNLKLKLLELERNENKPKEINILVKTVNEIAKINEYEKLLIQSNKLILMSELHEK